MFLLVEKAELTSRDRKAQGVAMTIDDVSFLELRVTLARRTTIRQELMSPYRRT
jgi:hypothetical protein